MPQLYHIFINLILILLRVVHMAALFVLSFYVG
nr:MAG TPA: hypothetical protein [Caudoviricetes sp.]